MCRMRLRSIGMRLLYRFSVFHLVLLVVGIITVYRLERLIRWWTSWEMKAILVALKTRVLNSIEIMGKEKIQVERKRKPKTLQIGTRLKESEIPIFEKYMAVYGVDDEGRASKSILIRKALAEFFENNPLPDKEDENLGAKERTK